MSLRRKTNLVDCRTNLPIYEGATVMKSMDTLQTFKVVWSENYGGWAFKNSMGLNLIFTKETLQTLYVSDGNLIPA